MWESTAWPRTKLSVSTLRLSFEQSLFSSIDVLQIASCYSPGFDIMWIHLIHVVFLICCHTVQRTCNLKKIYLNICKSINTIRDLKKISKCFLIKKLQYHHQARNQLETPGVAKSFPRGAQIFMSNSFDLCSTHFSRGGEILVTGLITAVSLSSKDSQCIYPPNSFYTLLRFSVFFCRFQAISVLRFKPPFHNWHTPWIFWKSKQWISRIRFVIFRISQVANICTVYYTT